MKIVVSDGTVWRVDGTMRTKLTASKAEEIAHANGHYSAEDFIQEYGSRILDLSVKLIIKES